MNFGHHSRNKIQPARAMSNCNVQLNLLNLDHLRGIEKYIVITKHRRAGQDNASVFLDDHTKHRKTCS